MVLQRGGAPFPGDTEKAGAGIRMLSFTAFSAQAGCRKWRANGFRDYLLLFKEKKKKHFNFANSTDVLKLAGILSSVQEKKGLEVGSSVFRQVAGLSAQRAPGSPEGKGSPNAQPLLCGPAGQELAQRHQGQAASLCVCAQWQGWLRRNASCEGRPLAASSKGQRSPLYRV